MTDLLIDAEDAEAFARPLIVGVPDRGRFGLRFPHADERLRSASYTFVGGTEPLIVSARGFDIDDEEEVEVLLNGISLGFLYPTLDGEVSDCHDAFFVPASALSEHNYLVVRQVGAVGERWGVQDASVMGRHSI